MLYRILPTLLLLALGLLTLPACQTAENAADTTGDAVTEAASSVDEVAENAVATTADGARIAAGAVADAAGATYNAAADLFDDDDSDLFAAALVRPTSEPGAMVQGTVRMKESGDDLVLMVSLRGLTPGSTHGLHVHEGGSCGMGDADNDGRMEPGGAAGGHYDPMRTNDHGAPTEELAQKHVGDFGNVTADARGMAEVTLRVDNVDPDGYDFVGRTVMVHSGRDDLESDPGGDAGARIGCGVIEGRM